MPRTLAGTIRAHGGIGNQADIARALGVSRARVAVIVRHPTFPAPVATVGESPVWAMNQVHEWRQNRATASPRVA